MIKNACIKDQLRLEMHGLEVKYYRIHFLHHRQQCKTIPLFKVWQLEYLKCNFDHCTVYVQQKYKNLHDPLGKC